MKKIKLIISLVLLAIVFVGCSDNSTTPEETKTMFGLKNNSYWINGYFSLTENNEFSTQLYNDSTFVINSVNWNEKQGFELKRIITALGDASTMQYYVSSNNDKYFISGHFLKSFINISDNFLFKSIDLKSFTDNWCLLADKTKSNFMLFDTAIVMTGMKIPNYEAATVDLSYNVDISKIEDNKFLDPMSNKLVNAIKYKLLHKIKVDVYYEVPIIGKQKIELENPFITFEQQITFAEGIGLAEGFTPNQNIEFTLKGKLIPQEIKVIDEKIIGEGFRVIRYKN